MNKYSESDDRSFQDVRVGRVPVIRAALHPVIFTPV